MSLLRPRPLAFLLVGCLLALRLGGPAEAADPRPGQTMAVSARGGASLRQAPQNLAAAVAVLPFGTKVVIQQVSAGWARVTSASAPPGRTAPSGWVRLVELADPSLVAGGPARPVAAGPAGGVSSKDVSAAGRQLDAGTEAGYRGLHPNIDLAYPFVQQMEDDSRTLDPNAVVAFVREGRFGGGRQTRLGPLQNQTAPAQPQGGGGTPGGGGKKKGPFGLPGGIVEEGLGALGLGKKEREIVGSAVQGVTGYMDELNKRFTPEQEYYLGRAVAANAIAQFGIDPDMSRRRYVQMVGQALVRTTGRLSPTWGGYHFDVLNSDEVNGVSGPGGFVLLTRGAVMTCRNEDELAAMLAHELTHIQLKHGEKVIREGGKMQALLGGLGNVGMTAAGLDDPKWREGLLKFFDQVVGEMVSTSVQHAYGRDKEFESDREGAYILAELGLDMWAMRDALQAMAATGHSHGGATHAPPEQRAATLQAQLSRSYQAYRFVEAKQVRAGRFRQTLGLASQPAPPR